MTCPRCGAPNQEGAEVCGGCGRSLFFLAVGTVLADRYEIQGVLGSGGLGRVYRARDRMLEETVAVKVLHPEASRSPELGRRFRSEIKLARKVRHRNVCAIHEYGEEGNLRFVAMELVDGDELHRILREQGPFPTPEAFAIVSQVTEGLVAIHDAGVIHRDLKTPNIMRDRSGVVRLLDFGIAKLIAPTGTLPLTAVQKVVGTPEYMSPEQIRGDELDPRSDLYSLGVVIFELFTGFVPFQGRTPVDTLLRQVNEPPPLYGDMAARLPAALVPVLARTLSKVPEDRPASARSLLDALQVVHQATSAQASLSSPDPSSALARERAPTAPQRPLTRGSGTPVGVPPPVERTSILPRAAGGPARDRGGSGLAEGQPPSAPVPPLVPPPTMRTAREEAAAAALADDRTYIELPAPPGVAESATGARRPGWPRRRLAFASGLSALLLVALVSWWLDRHHAITPAPGVSPGPSRGQRVSGPAVPPSVTPAPSPGTERTGDLAATPSGAEETESRSAHPSPAATPVATPQATPRATARPLRSRLPTPAPALSPTASPTPSPTPALALLDLDVHPQADVTAGDRKLGRTPLEGVPLEPGHLVLLIQHPDYWPLRHRLELEPGRRTRLQIDLQWEGVARGKALPYQPPSRHAPDDPYFLTGLRHMVRGDFQEAVVTLEPVVRRLEARDRPRELAQAQFFLGVALLELGRDVEARASFESALGNDGSLEPVSAAFPMRVTTFFGQVRDALRRKGR